MVERSLGNGRALFSELIPEGHEADMFALFEITDKGSSWLGPLVASIILQQTGKIRPVLIYLLCAMVLPALLLHRLDLTESIKSARKTGAFSGAAWAGSRSGSGLGSGSGSGAGAGAGLAGDVDADDEASGDAQRQ